MSNKVRKKVITKVQKTLNLDDSVKHIDARLSNFAKGWAQKQEELIKGHNALSTKIVEIETLQQQIAKFAAQEIGKIMAQQRSYVVEVGKSIDHLDMNVLATAEIMKEIFGQLTQVDDMLKAALNKVNLSNEELEKAIDTETIKARATEWFQDVVTSAFKTVQDNQAAEMQARLDAEQAAKEAAKAADEAKSEAERIESELVAAQAVDRGIQHVGTSGGPGAHIPEGAEVFGGA